MPVLAVPVNADTPANLPTATAQYDLSEFMRSGWQPNVSSGLPPAFGGFSIARQYGSQCVPIPMQPLVDDVPRHAHPLPSGAQQRDNAPPEERETRTEAMEDDEPPPPPPPRANEQQAPPPQQQEPPPAPPPRTTRDAMADTEDDSPQRVRNQECQTNFTNHFPRMAARKSYLRPAGTIHYKLDSKDGGMTTRRYGTLKDQWALRLERGSVRAPPYPDAAGEEEGGGEEDGEEEDDEEGGTPTAAAPDPLTEEFEAEYARRK